MKTKNVFIVALYFLLGLFLTACSVNNQDQKPSSQQELFQRESDHLLDRQDLQEIVKFQNLRETEKLIPFFKNDDPIIRARAAFAMASVQDSLALDDLLFLLNDSNDKVRLDAAFAIRQNYGKVAPQVLIRHFNEEKTLNVQAMLLTAIGFNGNGEDYDEVMKMNLPHSLATYQALCAIYFLEHNDIFKPSGIQRMLHLLESENLDTREKAGYFFYRLSNKGETSKQIAESLRENIKIAQFDDPAAPYILAYISKQADASDTTLLLNWSSKGSSLRSRSFAADQMKYYDQYPSIRSALIQHSTSDEFQVSLAATRGISGSENLNKANLEQLRKLLNEEIIMWQLSPYILNGLWKNGEVNFVISYLKKIPESQPLRLIHAFSEIESLDFDLFQEEFIGLVLSDNEQLALSSVEYLCAMLSRESNEKIVELLSTFLSQSQHLRIKSDAILSMAHNMKNTFPLNFRQDFFLEHLNGFKKESDVQSSAMCLLVLGDIQSKDVKQVINKFTNSTNKIERLAAHGALQILDLDQAEKIEVYRNEMLYSPILEIDWEMLSEYGRFPKFIFETTHGNIVIEADIEQAPMGIQNLINHINAGMMDSIHIYRVEFNHVTQFGALGHSEFRVLNEITRIMKEEGSCGIGSFGKDTGSQHIAITHLIRPHNEGKYTTFGRVVEGNDIVQRATKYDMIISARVIPES